MLVFIFNHKYLCNDMLFGKIKSQYGPRLRSFLYRKKLRVSTRSLKFWVTQLLKPPQECSVENGWRRTTVLVGGERLYIVGTYKL